MNRLLEFLESKYFQIIFVFIIITYTTSDYIFDPLTHMTTANVFPGIAPHLELGVPYKDYWDVYPPGIYLFYYLLYFVGKDFQLSYIITHILVLTFTIIIAYNLSKYFKNGRLIFLFGVIYFLSPLYIDYLMINDLIALFFSYLGLICFLKLENRKKYIISNFLMTFAFFVKETLIFAALSILVLQLLQKDYKNIGLSVLGTLLGVLLVFIYSFYFSIEQFVIESYLNKIQLFDFIEILTRYSVVFLAVVLIFTFNRKKRFSKYSINLSEPEKLIYLHSLLLIISFYAIGKDDGGHFDIPKIFATFFLLSIFINKKKNFVGLVLMLLISSYYLKINHSIFSYTIIEPNINVENFDKSRQTETSYVETLNNMDNNVLYLYGWGSTSFFYNYEVKPYTKFWLVHPQILSDEQISELKDTILANPPLLIHYCGFYDNCPAGFDFSEFESRYINFRYLISECYVNLQGPFYELKNNACVKGLNF
tara:strand:- start:690 stop:2129 length:1440 start_codon:yes stop_codon:yes gene_type:complete